MNEKGSKTHMDSEQRLELEQELLNVDAELDDLYFRDHQLQPFVDDSIRIDIYQLRARRAELKALLESTTGILE